jgi:hypothetical protein
VVCLPQAAHSRLNSSLADIRQKHRTGGLAGLRTEFRQEIVPLAWKAAGLLLAVRYRCDQVDSMER